MNRVTALIGASAICLATLEATDAPAAASQYVGTYELAVTVTSATAIPEGQLVYCLFIVSDTGDASGSNKGMNVGVATMDAAGTSGTCTVSIPYSWTLTTPASNRVTPSFAVAVAPKGKTEAALAIAGLRLKDLPSIVGVPTAAGHTTSLTATTRL
jgi:hypothetical protein